MNEEEVMAVIAHELGHVKCGHTLYTMMGLQIDALIAAIAHVVPAVGKLLELGVVAAFYTWVRRSELTADRAALLVMQNPQPSISMLMKLAGGTKKEAYQLDPEEFLNQARLYREEGSQGVANRIYRFLASAIAYKTTHPFAVERAHYLNEWIDSSEYDQILQGNYPRIPRKLLAQPAPFFQTSQERDIYCSRCGRKSLNAASKFCSGCGNAL